MEEVVVNDKTEMHLLGRSPKVVKHEIGFEQDSTQDLPMGKPRQQRPKIND